MDRELIQQEFDRINYIVEHDGAQAALDFCIRTRKIYRQAVLNKKHHASLRQYRRGFIVSYLVFKMVIENHTSLYPAL